VLDAAWRCAALIGRESAGMSNQVLRRIPARWSIRARLTAVATSGAGALLVAGALAMLAAVSVARGEIAAVAVPLVAVLALGVAGVGWIVWRAVDCALRPVRVMSDELRGTRTGGGRVTVPAGHDEVAELARSVNLTLGRLERMAERHRAFVADASHELRSPLTGLRTQLEVALEHPEDEDWPKVARAALDDADRLQRLVRDLLTMARLEAGVAGEDREPVDLAGLVRDEVARRRSGRVPIGLDLEDGVVVRAAPSHLARLLRNLLDNADRHARSKVGVTVGAAGGDAVLTVCDDGPGIPAQERERVFQRFQRLAEGRRCDAGGTGLGLPISREIAQAHGGSLVVGEGGEGGEGGGGARLILRLPRALG
jgi:signal transduction histidine kinase